MTIERGISPPLKRPWGPESAPCHPSTAPRRFPAAGALSACAPGERMFYRVKVQSVPCSGTSSPNSDPGIRSLSYRLHSSVKGGGRESLFGYSAGHLPYPSPHLILSRKRCKVKQWFPYKCADLFQTDAALPGVGNLDQLCDSHEKEIF